MPKHTIKPPQTDVSFPKLEQGVQRIWKREKTFELSLQQTRKGKRYTFYDGPPFATGLPHYGNLMQGIIKDAIPRFRTMQGRYVERRFGWDCHGLPVEYELEKKLGIKNRQEILTMGVGTFNDKAREIVLTYTKEWQRITERIGRWVDFKHDYKTMDPDYMESVWWVIKQLWDKGLLYEGRRSMQICPRCATPLSNFEVSQGYADRDDPAVYVKLPLRHDPAVSLLVWTTTPWTLPGNVLAAVNKHLDYVEVEHGGERLVLAEPRMATVFPNGDYTVRRKLRATELLGKQYEPPFPKRNLTGTSYEVVAADAVTADEGTGILHVAPAFGEEDAEIAKREQAAFIQHIDLTGTINHEAPRYRGQQALEANESIIADLKRSQRLLRVESIRHSYPHCWRCETPLLNYSAISWFVAVSRIRQELLAAGEKITWIPEYVKHGRFGKWLEGARDWSISRNRFWGNPLPIWRCPDDHLTVIGSLDELKKLSGKRPKDLHKQYVDKITFECPECGKKATRIEDVLDCWFESGSMPYAKEHYPFQHQKEFEESFPADFIAEALDQTRGWFYTLHVLAVALFDSPAFSNVVTTGIIQAEDGQKMSKSKKNYPDPEKLMNHTGADAMRLYILSSPVVKGDDLRFSERGVEEVRRNFVSTLYNVYTFFATYAAVDGWQAPQETPRSTHVLDRWILARTNSLIRATTEAFERNDLMAASRGLMDYLDELSNWYVRRSRRRFWKSKDDADKAHAYATLHSVLTALTRLAAPLTPFITDYIHRQLTGTSVHLAAWPKPSGKGNPDLERQMSVARQVVRLGLAARAQAKIKVRQPLSKVTVIDRLKSGLVKNKEVVQLLADELNVKQVSFGTVETGFVKEIVQPVPSELGPLFGRQAQAVIEEIKAGRYQRQGGAVVVRGRRLPAETIRITWEPLGDQVVESSADVVVAINPDLDQALLDEGRARELVRCFQELRKESGLQVDDRINASVTSDDPDLERAISAHRELITQEVLALSLEQTPPSGDNTKSVKVDGATAEIGLNKAS